MWLQRCCGVLERGGCSLLHAVVCPACTQLALQGAAGIAASAVRRAAVQARRRSIQAHVCAIGGWSLQALRGVRRGCSVGEYGPGECEDCRRCVFAGVLAGGCCVVCAALLPSLVAVVAGAAGSCAVIGSKKICRVEPSVCRCGECCCRGCSVCFGWSKGRYLCSSAAEMRALSGMLARMHCLWSCPSGAHSLVPQVHHGYLRPKVRCQMPPRVLSRLPRLLSHHSSHCTDQSAV